jgi:WD40 repeat protein
MGCPTGRITDVRLLDDGSVSVTSEQAIALEPDQSDQQAKALERLDWYVANAQDAIPLGSGLILIRERSCAAVWNLAGNRLVSVLPLDSAVPVTLLSETTVWAAGAIWDLESGRQQQSCLGLGDHPHTFANWSPDVVLPDGRLVSFDEDGCLRVWDPAHSRCDLVLDGHGSREFGESGVILHEPTVLVSWNHSGDRSAFAWDVVQGIGRPLLDEEGEPAAWVEGAVSLDDGRVMTWGIQPRVHHVATGECVRSLEDCVVEFDVVTRLRDGRVCGAGKFWQEGGSIRVIDPDSNRVETWSGHGGQVKALLEFPNGCVASFCRIGHGRDARRLYGDDGTVRVWDSVTGTCVARFAGHRAEVIGVIGLDGDEVASWDADGMLFVWDSRGGSQSDAEVS